ncbi:MAG: restriction endonuclease [Treponemataceae bacterium]|nr:restriction endonuclease [Treponemataceae bacterium]
MNYWMDLSIQYANQRNYLDDLFCVYPTIPNGIREIDQDRWSNIEQAFMNKDDNVLIKYLLYLDLFPIKDSYVAFLKRDPTAIKRNPKTVARLCGRLYEMGLDKIYEKCTEPKETNRQIGPLFKRWCKTKALGVVPVTLHEFCKNNDNAILTASDAEMQSWAAKVLGYKRNKGLDFIARFNGKYVIGEAKFLSDFGGHQDAQLEDAILTLKELNVKAMKIAILDGVVWLKTQNKMYKTITEKFSEENIMSALVLREFLYSL